MFFAVSERECIERVPKPRFLVEHCGKVGGNSDFAWRGVELELDVDFVPRFNACAWSVFGAEWE